MCWLTGQNWKPQIYINNIHKGEGSIKQFFYRPTDGVSGDYIPFYDNGSYHLFYLKDYRDPEKYGDGTPWFHISTEDLVNFKDHGEAIPRGGHEDQDLWVFTGSVIKALGQYHIFYTGHNGYFLNTPKPMQAIMHAVSDDLDHWTKIPEDTFYANTEYYEKDDFRDPFVFFDEKTQQFQMLLVCRKKNCGTIAGFTDRFSSADLKHWKEEGAFWAPDLYINHECPDLFRINDWWYLIYSEYSDKSLTRYVMSKSMDGPWTIPADDAFDGRAYYAAKTAGNEKERFLFGWIPTKEGEKDTGNWQWGGNLAIHQLVQRKDGTLGCKLPDSIRSAFAPAETAAAPVTVQNPCGRADQKLFTAGEDTLIEMTIQFAAGPKSFGITLGQDFTSKQGYKYEFSPSENQVRFDSVAAMICAQNMNRPVALSPDTEIKLSLLLGKEAVVLYVNGDVALSSRMYEMAGNDISVYAVGGSVTVKEAVLLKPDEK